MVSSTARETASGVYPVRKTISAAASASRSVSFSRRRRKLSPVVTMVRSPAGSLRITDRVEGRSRQRRARRRPRCPRGTRRPADRTRRRRRGSRVRLRVRVDRARRRRWRATPPNAVVTSLANAPPSGSGRLLTAYHSSIAAAPTARTGGESVMDAASFPDCSRYDSPYTDSWSSMAAASAIGPSTVVSPPARRITSAQGIDTASPVSPSSVSPATPKTTRPIPA